MALSYAERGRAKLSSGNGRRKCEIDFLRKGVCSWLREQSTVNSPRSTEREISHKLKQSTVRIGVKPELFTNKPVGLAILEFWKLLSIKNSLKVV